MAEKIRPAYPVFVDLAGRRAVVVGGSEAAERKARALVRCGAVVTVIAPQVTDAIEEMCAAGDLAVEPRDFVSGDLEGAFLVACASGSREVDLAVSAEAEARGCLINVVDRPEMCNFIVPSVLRRGRLQVAVSTGGVAPGVAKRVRGRIAEDLGPEWAEYVELLANMREMARARIDDEARRARVLDALADTDELRQAIATGAGVDAEQAFMKLVVDARG